MTTSFQSLSILRQLTLAFPEDGEVTAKTIEIHDGSTVSCSGTARDNAGVARGAVQAALGGRRERLEGGVDSRQVADAVHV